MQDKGIASHSWKTSGPCSGSHRQHRHCWGHRDARVQDRGKSRVPGQHSPAFSWRRHQSTSVCLQSTRGDSPGLYHFWPCWFCRRHRYKRIGYSFAGTFTFVLRWTWFDPAKTSQRMTRELQVPDASQYICGTFWRRQDASMACASAWKQADWFWAPTHLRGTLCQSGSYRCWCLQSHTLKPRHHFHIFEAW